MIFHICYIDIYIGNTKVSFSLLIAFQSIGYLQTIQWGFKNIFLVVYFNSLDQLATQIIHVVWTSFSDLRVAHATSSILIWICTVVLHNPEPGVLAIFTYMNQNPYMLDKTVNKSHRNILYTSQIFTRKWRDQYSTFQHRI